MTIDVDEIRRNNPIEQVVGRIVALKKRGSEYVGLCPFHSEKTPSFTAVPDKQFAQCFGCGWHGDVIDFVQKTQNLDFTSAAAALGYKNGASVNGMAAPPHAPPPVAVGAINAHTEPTFAEVQITDEMVPQPGITFTAWNPRKNDGAGAWAKYRPEMVHVYRDATGEILGLVVRHIVGGKKSFLPIRGAEIEGKDALAVWAMDTPRPLYGLDLLDPFKEVLIVEGEKSADAARRLLPTLSVVTWPGGTAGAKHADFTPLAGMNVCVWPDADAPGEKCANAIVDSLKEIGANVVRAMPWDKTKDKGWDIADWEAVGATTADVEAYIGQQAVVVHDPSTAPASPGTQPATPPQHTGRPFRVLGYNLGNYFYLPDGVQQIIELSPGGHTTSNLLQLAPLDYWVQMYPPDPRSRSGAKFDVTNATDALMQEATIVGIFNMERLRGRGAWIDDRRPVVHLGNVICIGPDRYKPTEVPSDFIYPAADPLNVAIAAPATNGEANKLVTICEKLTWENKMSGSLLAGWCVVAMVCGALQWRPHIWLTGSATSGKSTAVEEIVLRVLGKIALKKDGTTTEASIRQTLFRDARPVIIDEAEPNVENINRMRNLMTFARVSSDGGEIGKGSATGEAINYVARSCFMFASINTALTGYADMTRFSKLILKAHPGTNEAKEAHYADLMKDITTTFTPDYSVRMFSRSLQNLDTLLANAQTFIDACAEVLHQRRGAKQIGSMLAGLFLCYSTARISKADAIAWVAKHPWDDHIANPDATDDKNLLTYLMSQRRRLAGERTNREATIGELIALSMGEPGSDIGVDESEARKELGRIGIRIPQIDEMYSDYGQQVFIVANRSPELAKVLTNTPWVSDWQRPLESLPGASKVKKVFRFSPGLIQRGTIIPYDLIGTSNVSPPAVQREIDLDRPL